MSINAADILAVTKSVTKEWTKQRKAEERGSRSRSLRKYIYSERIAFTEVADAIIPPGYAHSSGDGHYTMLDADRVGDQPNAHWHGNGASIRQPANHG